MSHELPEDLAAQVHRASADAAIAARVAFDYLADGMRLGEWALGSWDVVDMGDGIVRGRSLFDDSHGWVRPVGEPERLRVVYHVGASVDALQPRIVAEVLERSPDAIGRPRCRISLVATRSDGMDDARWLRLMRCHEVEVLLIQSRLALVAAARAP